MKLSIKDYMESRNISRRTVYNRIQAGQLETIKEKNKTYIIKENEVKVETKKNTSNIDLSVFNDLKDFSTQLSLIQSSYNLIKEFDYNFLRDRLSSIEKSLISFFLESEKNINTLNQSTNNSINELLQKINNLDEKDENFLKTILVINEQNQNFFKQNIENINEKFDILINRFEIFEEKFEEILKNPNSKKIFNPFKK